MRGKGNVRTENCKCYDCTAQQTITALRARVQELEMPDDPGYSLEQWNSALGKLRAEVAELEKFSSARVAQIIAMKEHIDTACALLEEIKYAELIACMTGDCPHDSRLECDKALREIIVWVSEKARAFLAGENARSATTMRIERDAARAEIARHKPTFETMGEEIAELRVEVQELEDERDDAAIKMGLLENEDQRMANLLTRVNSYVCPITDDVDLDLDIHEWRKARVQKGLQAARAEAEEDGA